MRLSHILLTACLNASCMTQGKYFASYMTKSDRKVHITSSSKSIQEALDQARKKCHPRNVGCKLLVSGKRETKEFMVRSHRRTKVKTCLKIDDALEKYEECRLANKDVCHLLPCATQDFDPYEIKIAEDKADWCYKPFLKKETIPQGKVKLELNIKKDGRVKSAKILKSDFKEKSFHTCLIDRMTRQHRFLPPRGQKETKLILPLNFKPEFEAIFISPFRDIFIFKSAISEKDAKAKGVEDCKSFDCKFITTGSQFDFYKVHGRDKCVDSKKLSELAEKCSSIQSCKISKCKILGGLTTYEVQAEVISKLNTISTCYIQKLKKSPKAAGKIKVQFVIAASGKVSSSKIFSSSFSDQSFHNCVLKAVNKFQFIPPRGKEEVRVNFPFIFDPI